MPTIFSRDRGTRSQGRQPSWPFHRRRRSRPLHRALRDEASRQSGPHRRRATNHVEIRHQSGGPPIEVFDDMRSGLTKDRSQFYKDLAMAFYGANREGAKVSKGIQDQFWLWSMQAGLKNAYESIKAFSETDFTEDLKKFDVPTLVMHGEDDQIVPVKDGVTSRPGSSKARRKSTILARLMASRPRIRISSTLTLWPS